MCVGVIDGDTIVVQSGEWAQVFDIDRIDAPELDQPFGKEAKEALSGMVLDREVVIRLVESSQPMGRVTVDGHDVSMAMVERGLAHLSLACKDQQLALALFVARQSKIGLWEDPAPVFPAKWRSEQKAGETPTPVVQQSEVVAPEKRLRSITDSVVIEDGVFLTQQMLGAGAETPVARPGREAAGLTVCVAEASATLFSRRGFDGRQIRLEVDPNRPGEGEVFLELVYRSGEDEWVCDQTVSWEMPRMGMIRIIEISPEACGQQRGYLDSIIVRDTTCFSRKRES